MPASKRILLVNDNKKATQEIKDMFKNTGLRISTAGSEFGMFNSIEEYGKVADMVMLDLALKKGDSLTLLTKLRQNEKYQNLPVIILGESVEKETLLKMKEMRVHTMMKKPVNRDLLLQRIRTILNME